MSAAIQTQQLSHRYGSHQALRSLSMTIDPAEIYGILGPNGGGKTTLFRILSTMMRASEGDAWVMGNHVGQEPATVRRHLGVVFQNASLDPMLTGKENLTHQGHLYGLRGADLKERIAKRAEQMGIADRLSDRVGKLSGGLKRRLDMAKALLHEPQVLLLDEPTTALDPGARRQVWSALRELSRDSGVTVVLTTHLMEEAERCDRLGILDTGELIATGSPQELRESITGQVITVSATDPTAAAASLRDELGLYLNLVGGQLRMDTTKGGEVAKKILELGNGTVRGVTVGPPSLEDVFVQLTGRGFEEKQDEAEEVKS